MTQVATNEVPKTSGQQIEEKKDDAQKNVVHREIDLREIFGDPDVLNEGESVRSIAKPLPAWQIYFMSWGAWLAVRCDEIISYIKKMCFSTKKRVFAIVGWHNAQKRQQSRKA